jgi:hypothetical protein
LTVGWVKIDLPQIGTPLYFLCQAAHVRKEYRTIIY